MFSKIEYTEFKQNKIVAVEFEKGDYLKIYLKNTQYI